MGARPCLADSSRSSPDKVSVIPRHWLTSVRMERVARPRDYLSERILVEMITEIGDGPAPDGIRPRARYPGTDRAPGGGEHQVEQLGGLLRDRAKGQSGHACPAQRHQQFLRRGVGDLMAGQIRDEHDEQGLERQQEIEIGDRQGRRTDSHRRRREHSCQALADLACHTIHPRREHQKDTGTKVDVGLQEVQETVHLVPAVEFDAELGPLGGVDVRRILAPLDVRGDREHRQRHDVVRVQDPRELRLCRRNMAQLSR
jgi:hypothetical protein